VARIVAVEARHDTPTRRAFDYRDLHFYQTPPAQAPGTLEVIRGPLARRGRVATTLVTSNPALLTAVGHGDVDTMMGFGSAALWEPGRYAPHEVAGRIVHLVACETARQLGPDLVAQGARAFVGYDVIVMLHDDVFEPFMECDTLIDLTLLAGGTVAAAHAAALTRFDQHIDRFKAAGDLFQAAVMQTHRDSLCSPVTDAKFGDPNATL
jgi:hypothetical protein